MNKILAALIAVIIGVTIAPNPHREPEKRTGDTSSYSCTVRCPGKLNVQHN